MILLFYLLLLFFLCLHFRSSFLYQTYVFQGWFYLYLLLGNRLVLTSWITHFTFEVWNAMLMRYMWFGFLVSDLKGKRLWMKNLSILLCYVHINVQFFMDSFKVWDFVRNCRDESTLPYTGSWSSPILHPFLLNFLMSFKHSEDSFG